MRTPCEIMEEAIQLEKGGEEFYREQAGKAENPLAAKTFEWLADEELKHRQVFETAYAAIQGTDVCPALQDLGHSHTLASEAAREIFEAARADLEDEATSDPQIEQAYATAMRMERETIDLYRRRAEEAEDDNERKLYEFLLVEERDHLNLLATTEEYLNDTAYWYFKEEQWIVTG